MSTADDHPALTPAQRRSLRISLTWVVIIVVTIVALQIPLPSVVTIGPTWLVPFIELIGIPIVGILFLAGRHDRLVTGTMTAFLAFLVTGLEAVLALTGVRMVWRGLARGLGWVRRGGRAAAQAA